MPRIFSREQFHEMVWSKPMTELAKEFGRSDVALHKVCKKHDVPRPPLGWWAKKAAGKPVAVTPLPPSGKPSKIVIREREPENELVESTRAKARQVGARRTEADTAKPLIERTVAELKKAIPRPNGLVATEGRGVIACQVSPSSIARLGDILGELASAAAAQGFALVAREGSAQFKSDAGCVAFSILEKFKRTKHALTAEERAAKAAWQAQSEAAWKKWNGRGSAFDHWEASSRDEPQFADWDYEHTGLLSVELEVVHLGLTTPRHAFRDGITQRLERMASEIAIGIAVIAAAKTKRQREAEERERHEREARVAREAEARRKHVEGRRSAALAMIAADLEEIERLKRVLPTWAPDRGAEGHPRFATFLEWIVARQSELEQRISPGFLEARFEEDRLFGDDDDHAFCYDAYRDENR
ncbi:hypothetical protein [Sphingomonas sanxanigenens]|uniref:Uncharacterized protein n=1 Tax=Sphingomonas sanxanigenens DSM 19645 = NX02 TaxID=1123269 RepID=W0A4E7_9SPHN|nr:hypothetical protein [Sphingomonas sanxanigenens]AHE52834.1 hypothetical protein NX02_05475 [Sphingomonas sanxanigenens DSM 19645 = NX02]